MKNKPNPIHPMASTFQEYLDGELPMEECARFEAHLEVCKDCKIALAYWQNAFQKIENLPRIELRQDLASQVLSDLETPLETKNVLHMILAEAAIGTTLGFVLWPGIRAGWDQLSVGLGNSWQSGVVQVQQIIAGQFDLLTFSPSDWLGLEIGSLTGEHFLLPTIIAALVLLVLGNRIVLKTTQTNQ